VGCFYRSFYIHGPEKRLVIGDNSVIAGGCIVNTRSGRVTIGDNCQIANGCLLLTGLHLIDHNEKARRPAVPDAGRDILIGDHVWIGSGSIIVGFCHIPNDCVVQAGSVCTGRYDPKSMIGNQRAVSKRLIQGGYDGSLD